MISEITQVIVTRFQRQSGIIYCLSRKLSDTVARNLQNKGIKANSYHAGMTDEERSESQLKWSNGIVQVIVLYSSPN